MCGKPPLNSSPARIFVGELEDWLNFLEQGKRNRNSLKTQSFHLITNYALEAVLPMERRERFLVDCGREGLVNSGSLLVRWAVELQRNLVCLLPEKSLMQEVAIRSEESLRSALNRWRLEAQETIIWEDGRDQTYIYLDLC